MRWIVVLLGLLALVGCGGGGGGGASTDGCREGAIVSSFRYTTDWGASDSSAGLSQVVTLYDLNRTAVGSRVLNRGGETSTIIANLTSGTFIVQADLRSQADGAGTTVGTTTTRLDICGDARAANTFSTVVGAPVASVSVVPSSVTVKQNESAQFYATALDAQGRSVFTSATDLAWDALGGVASVQANGLALATNPGTGGIRARHLPSGLTGTGALTVEPFAPARTKWTILVYVNAANDLYSYSVPNVNQLESVAGNPDVRFVLQWKQSRSQYASSTFDGTRRYVVRQDSGTAIASQLVQDMGTNVDMGDPDTLKDFIEWGRALYPADRFGLIIWNHGNGWRRSTDAAQSRAVSYDDQTGNAIQIWQLDGALGTQPFEFLAWDASLMQMLEVAYEVRGKAKYVVGSEESPPGEGYPYDDVFGPWRDNPDGATSGLLKSFVDAMVNHTPYAGRKITQSVIDSSKLGALAGKVDQLASDLVTHRAELTTIIPAIRDSAQSYSPTQFRYYRDLRHLCDLLIARGDVPPQVAASAAQVRDAVIDAVVWEGHNSYSPNSKGLAIDFSSGQRFSASASDYAQMKLAQDTRWDEWLLVAP